ncbi:hypothetical protein N7474_003891 [Penicillium riverlandense]|uniref:uncharacterized protein n=1 Tax=Penicillium riverlandense TaxID=1903569 RepID=UPI002548E987|nr:uncharacterized protein N7474_003891 [Penicillium riverlandense]KAJ5818300.1 hypothetical protein N7474_003891 [Penicillium riverlandense]
MSSRSASIDSADSAPPPQDEQGPARIYAVYKNSFRRHYEIKSLDDQILFYADVSSLTRNKPDITLHAGTDTNAPIVAVSQFLKLSSNYKLGLGNPDDPGNMQWEDMTRESIRANKHRIEMNIRNSPGPDTPAQRRSFLWKRTRHVVVDDSSRRWGSVRNYKLVDESSDQVVAIFTSERTYNKCGKIQIKVEYGDDFDRIVFISCLSLYEKAKRRARAASAGGGGA